MLEPNQLELIHTPWSTQAKHTRRLHDLTTANDSEASQRKAWWLTPVALLVAVFALPAIAIISLPA